MIPNLGRLRIARPCIQPGLSFSFISLGLSARRLGEAHKSPWTDTANLENSKRFWLSVPGLYAPPSSRAGSQREINHAEKMLRRQVPRDQKSPRFLIAPPAPKISEILEPLAFPKGSKISKILEPLGSPQEAF